MASGFNPLRAITAALRSSSPQKSAVNTPALKAKRQNRMNSRMDTTLTTMTMAFRNAALSTPLITRNVMAHRKMDTITMLRMPAGSVTMRYTYTV